MKAKHDIRSEEYRRELAERLAVYYDENPCLVAAICDECLDKSGNLLGWVRTAVMKNKRAK